MGSIVSLRQLAEQNKILRPSRLHREGSAVFNSHFRVSIVGNEAAPKFLSGKSQIPCVNIDKTCCGLNPTLVMDFFRQITGPLLHVLIVKLAEYPGQMI